MLPTLTATIDENRTRMRVTCGDLHLGTLYRQGFARDLPGNPRVPAWRWGDGAYHARCRMDSPRSFWEDAELAARFLYIGTGRHKLPVTFRLDRSAS